nr:MAG TPA: hypothetical protein [Caudoviricetes sp.]
MSISTPINASAPATPTNLLIFLPLKTPLTLILKLAFICFVVYSKFSFIVVYLFIVKLIVSNFRVQKYLIFSIPPKEIFKILYI